MFLKRKTFYLNHANVKNEGTGSKFSIFKGLFLGLMSGISYSIVSVMVKGMTNLHPGQLAVYRFLALFFMSMPETLKTGQNPFGPKNSRWFILFRGIFGSINIFLSFMAFRYLNLSEASAIIFSSPVFVTVFARIFLNEPCGAFQTLTVAVTVIGIVFATKVPSQLTENPIVYSHEKIYGLLAAISSAVFIGFETIAIRKVKSVHDSVMMFNFGWFAFLASLLLTAVSGNFRWHPASLRLADWAFQLRWPKDVGHCLAERVCWARLHHEGGL